jgi:hypothetical protein
MGLIFKLMQGLELLLQDFGEISRKAFELRDREKAARKEDFESSFAYSMALHELRFLDDERLVWYDGREGFMPEVPIGNPEDYLAIRDNYDTLKEFIGKTLDRGRVHAGGGTHGDSSRETNCADYVVWLHRHNQNQEFKRNVERATTELLEEAFGRAYTIININPALEREEDMFQRIYHGNINEWLGSMLHRDNLHSALWRLGLDNVVSDEDKEFRAKFEAEVKKTERPITLKEVYDRYGGTKTQLKKSFEAGEFADVIHPHYDEMPDEIKAELREWHKRNQATKSAVRDFSPQFNRLVGLLDVVSEIGEHDERFTNVYSLLKQRAEGKFMTDAPTITHYYSGSNIYQSVLVALSAVQQGTELEQFWLDNVRSDKNSERVIASVHGLLNIHDAPEERRKLIPSLLDRLQQRGYDVDKGYQRHSMIGFYTDENLLRDITEHITNICFPRETYHHLDKGSASLDFLQDRSVAQGRYTFRFIRYNPQGVRNLNVAFNVAEDSVEGNTELEGSVRAYLRENGYELPNDVWITSLEGRKILGIEAKVVKADGKSVDGLYEGLVGLNHTHFPFIFNESDGTIMLAEPIDSKTVMFGVGGGWEERRPGLDKVEKLVEYSQFQPLSRLGARVNQLVVERKKQGYLGDALYSLKDKLTDEISPYLSSVIGGRLVQQSDGLVR